MTVRDDTFLIAYSSSVLSLILADLEKEFLIIHLGRLHYFLNVKHTSKNSLFLDQSKYAKL